MATAPRSAEGHRPPTTNTPPRKRQKKANAIGLYSAGDKNPILFWDCLKRPSAPEVEKITDLHVYDFDNTLFRSPLPNPALFTDKALGSLTNSTTMIDGGWWQDPAPLRQMCKSDGETWNEYWNEDLVKLLRMSNECENVLTIILTGRKNKKFKNVISDILETKGVECDALILKQGTFDTTMAFKTQVLVDIFDFYKNITLVKIFDDRASQITGFERCLNEYIEAVRPQMVYSLIPVFSEKMHLDPDVELQIVSEMIDKHNTWMDHSKKKAPLAKLTLKKSFMFVSYYVEEETRAELIPCLTSNFPDIFTNEVLDSYKFELEHIPLSRGMLSRKTYRELTKTLPEVSWQVSHIGTNHELIALLLEPTQGIETLIDPPILAVATRGNAMRAPEDFLEIKEWRLVQDTIEIKSMITHIIKYNITSDSKVTK